MPKLKLEDKILKTAHEHPEQLTSVKGFARFLIQEHKLKYTPEALSYHVRKIADTEGIKFGADINNKIQEDLDRYRAKSSETVLQRQYKQLLSQYTQLQDEHDRLLEMDAWDVTLMDIPRDTKHLKGQAVPFMIWSDWHVEKRIDAEVMNGLNEFNPEIAKDRVKALAQNTVRMLDIHRHSSTITQGVLHLGGDFIEGYLREYNLRNNWMSPIEATPFAAELIISGMEYLLSANFLEVLYVLESRGNHPRLTKKMDSDDYKMNLEALIYHMVRQHFKTDKRVVFVTSKTDILYFDIMGKRVRAFHGHQVQYGGGIGGLAIPLRKAILNWDQTDPADYNMMGHFHQSHKPLGNTMMNGSLCGFDHFAMSAVKAAFQPPLQSMEMLVEGRGFRMFTSIDCE